VFLRSGEADGERAIVPMETMWALSQVWYRGRLDPGFTPRPRDESQQLLAAHGLTGDFWALG
jgi:hypothetical protein